LDIRENGVEKEVGEEEHLNKRKETKIINKGRKGEQQKKERVRQEEEMQSKREGKEMIYR
jgi:hypothetical protein